MHDIINFFEMIKGRKEGKGREKRKGKERKQARSKKTEHNDDRS